MFPELAGGSHSSSCSNIMIIIMFPEVPGVMSLHIASCQEWVFDIYLMAAHNRHPKIRHPSLLVLPWGLHTVHVVPKTCGQDRLLQNSQPWASVSLRSRLRDISFPPLSALLRISLAGLITCAQKEDSQYCLGFIWRGGRAWEVLLGKVGLGCRIRPWRAMYIQYLEAEGKKNKQNNPPNISYFNSFRRWTISSKEDGDMERYSRAECSFVTVNLPFLVHTHPRETHQFLYAQIMGFFLSFQ